MATVTPPTNPAPVPAIHAKRADWQRKVSDPLERLRGYIRLYVVVEGAAVLLLYLSLWYWISLAIDYGCFKVFNLDWVQVPGSRAFRGSILILLIAGLIALLVLKVTLRLLRDFKDAALALVLEKRFPKLLGDRLITAVELADPAIAAKCGYSQPMIDQTIQDAAERVDHIPVKEAFNWRRLWRYGIGLLVLTLGLLLGTWGMYATVIAISNAVARTRHFDGLVQAGKDEGEARAEADALPGKPADFTSDFGTVSGIWFERNILLRDVIWPRRARLEIVFPEKQVHTIGKNVGSCPIRVRAMHWIIADSAADEGWRAMNWKDLTPAMLFGTERPNLPPAVFAADYPWTVDQVESMLNQDDIKAAIDPGTAQDIKGTIQQLKESAALPANARKFRELTVPDTVVVYYWGDTIRSEMTLKLVNNEYTGTITDLKEPVQYSACAEDYCTATRNIDVVPPPSLSQLTRKEWHPAYLYHRAPRDAEDNDLKGLRQEFPEENVYLGGETSRIDLPAGADLLLTGSTGPAEQGGKELVNVTIEPRQLGEFAKTLSEEQKKDPLKAWLAAKGVQDGGAVLMSGGRTFTLRINKVTSRLDFDLVFPDKEGVIGKRHILIQPAEDVGPEVEVNIDVVRRTPGGYMITPQALVPLSGWIRDDHGLSKVNYHATYSRLEAASVGTKRAELAAMALHLTPESVGLPGIWGVPAYLGFMNRLIEPSTGEEERTMPPAPLVTFDRVWRDLARNDIPRADLEKRLKGRPDLNRLPLIRRHELRDQEGFDLLQRLPGLKVSGESAEQPHYRVVMWVEATDNNVENKTGPRTAKSKEQFTLLVVSEMKLLSEIAKEEEGLKEKLGPAADKVKTARTKLEEVTRILNASDVKADDYATQATQMAGIGDTVGSTSITAKEVWRDYSRILAELQTNRVQPKMIKKVDEIVNLLDSVINREFPAAEEAQREYQKALEKNKNDPALAKAAKERLDELIDKLAVVMSKMGDLTDINKIITQLQEILAAQQEVTAQYKYLQQRLEKELFGDDDEKPKK